MLDEFGGTCTTREHVEIILADTEVTGKFLKEMETTQFVYIIIKKRLTIKYIQEYRVYRSKFQIINDRTPMSNKPEVAGCLRSVRWDSHHHHLHLVLYEKVRLVKRRHVQKGVYFYQAHGFWQTSCSTNILVSLTC
jgi:hypothetical protein